MSTKRKTKNIVRIIAGGQKGWQVRINRRGEKFHPYFSDSKFGGARKALAEATEVRDRIERENPPHTRRSRAEVLMRSNKSGVAGVNLRFQVRRLAKGRRTYVFVEAAWSSRPGVVHRHRFSVDKYGRKKAWALAIAARKAGLDQMTD